MDINGIGAADYPAAGYEVKKSQPGAAGKSFAGQTLWICSESGSAESHWWAAMGMRLNITANHLMI